MAHFQTHSPRIKAPKASTSKQKLERCHIGVLYWFFRNEEVCEAASLREGSEHEREGLMGMHVGGEVMTNIC